MSRCARLYALAVSAALGIGAAVIAPALGGDPASAATPAEVSLWPDTAVPAVVTVDDSRQVELGVKFRSDIAGSVTGVRFYKGPSNTGTHVGSLWTTDGRRLASVTFANETAQGWQRARFSSAVRIRAGVTYVVSYNTRGRFSVDRSYFAGKGRDAGPLHAPSTAAASGNGVYRYGTRAFPNKTYAASNYWVDVMFMADGLVNPTPTASASRTPTPTPTPTPTITPPPTSTPTATPTPTPTSSVRTCAGFPDGTCTGVPAGTALTVHSGNLTVTSAGTVVDARDIRGCVIVRAPNVTIRRSRISGCAGQHTTVVRNGGNPVVLEDVEINGGYSDGNVDLAGVGSTEVTCRRCNLHGLTKGAHLDGANYVIENSWIHDLYMPGTSNSHGEAIYTDLTSNGIIRGNNLDSRNVAGNANNSASLAIYNLYGGHNNLVVENNLFNTDAAICMYVGYTHNATYALTNVRVVNNTFGRKYHQACGSWQPVWSAGGHRAMGWGSNGNVWSGNRFTDGVAVAAPY